MSPKMAPEAPTVGLRGVMSSAPRDPQTSETP